MKVIKDLVKLSLVLLLSVSIFSCSDGEDGAIGPAGSEGPAGTQGDQGTQGNPGDSGDPGTANVMYSDWIDTEIPVLVASPNTVFDIEAPEITAEHLDTAVILVFGQRRVADGATGAILSTNFQLPVTFISNGIYRAQILSPSASDKGVAVVRIRLDTNDGTNIDTGNYLQRYRYVIIPGGQLIKSASAKSTVDYTTMSYKEITELFNIQ